MELELFGVEFENVLPTVGLYVLILVFYWGFFFEYMGEFMSLGVKILLTILSLPMTYFIVMFYSRRQ